MRKRFVAASAALIAASVFLSCATAPDWISRTPPPDSVNTWFVGSASGKDEAAAVNDATANLIAGIMQYMGVRVTVNTSAMAKASLESYTAEITQTVAMQSENRLAGFQVKQKYKTANPKTKTATVHILAAYNTAELQKEKRRIEALFQEKIDAVAVPEAEGDSLAASGMPVDAVRKYIEAAVAASGSDIENADVKFERLIGKARAALSGIRFVVIGDDYSAVLGQAFPRPFKVRLEGSGGGTSAPSAGFDHGLSAKLLVSYQRKQASGRLAGKTESAQTDASGLLVFTPPVPDFVGKAKLSVRLDLQSSLEMLDALPPKFSALRSALQEDILAKQVEIGYAVVSEARKVPTGISIVDFDENGNRIPGDLTQAALLDSLGKEKFIVRATPLDPGLLSTMSDAAILNTGLQSWGSAVQRIVYGAARTRAVKRDGTNFLASASAQIKVVELATGTILYSSDKAYTAVGTDETGARRAALRELGAQVFGADILSSLP